jgi:terminase small subunit / prophage DNA-packing protein
MGEKVNKQRLQAILGKDHKTLLKWQKEGMPIHKEGARGKSHTFDTEVVIDWLIARASGKDQLEQARIRLTIAQAMKAELEIEEYLGNLINLDKMKHLWAGVLASCRARILSLPSRLAPVVATHRDPKKIEKVLKEACDEALTDLANYDPETNDKATPRRTGNAKGSRTSTTS